MKNNLKIVVFVIVLVASISKIQSTEIEVMEGNSITISCPPGQKINIESSEWKYKLLSVKNGFTPSFRNFFYIPGYFLGSCTYDVTSKTKEMCSGRKECVFTPSKELFDGCSYEMFLKMFYWCGDTNKK